MRSRDTDIIIVPGLGGSEPDHWQSRWQSRLPNAHRIEPASWDEPDHSDWIEALAVTIARCRRPVIVVAHSLGVTTLVHAADRGLAQIAGAFLVAPPDDLAILSFSAVDPAFAPTPLRPLDCPSVTVGSRNDPYVPSEQSLAYAQAWGSTFIDAGEAGHINIASGHGPWPEGLMSFAGFLSKLEAPRDAGGA